MNLLSFFTDKFKPGKGSCLEWAGATSSKGYGVISIGNKTYRTHRISYQLFNGPVEKNLVCHSCDNPACGNPNHLFLGSPKDNTQDMVKKGRHFSPGRLIRECPQGHAYTKENTYNLLRGGRACRACGRKKALARYYKNKENGK